MPSRFSRREFTQVSGAALLSWTLGNAGSDAAAQTPLPTPRPQPRMSADDALKEMMDGNARFVKGELRHPRARPEDFKAVATGQKPLAAVIGCADSRVPPEILFDMGIGDLFVIRVAGNVVNSAGAVIKASVEFAVEQVGVPLVVILGHSQCAAVRAAVQYHHDRHSLPGSITSLIHMIEPAVAKVEHDPGDLLTNAISANVRLGMEQLRALKPIVSEHVRQGHVKIAGAVYDLQTGKANMVSG